MQLRSILHKPSSEPKGLHVKFDLKATPPAIKKTTRKRKAKAMPDAEKHPLSEDAKWKKERSVVMAAALALLEFSKSPVRFDQPAQEPQQSKPKK
jgi:hypothetical protein